MFEKGPHCLKKKEEDFNEPLRCLRKFGSYWISSLVHYFQKKFPDKDEQYQSDL